MRITGRSRVGSTRRGETGSVSRFETGHLPWDIEMVVEDPLSDDEDGIPDCDSHSECDFDSLESIGDPSIFNIIRSVTDLTRM